jgi:hypothetical protein
VKNVPYPRYHGAQLKGGLFTSGGALRGRGGGENGCGKWGSQPTTTNITNMRDGSLCLNFHQENGS